MAKLERAVVSVPLRLYLDITTVRSFEASLVQGLGCCEPGQTREIEHGQQTGRVTADRQPHKLCHQLSCSPRRL